MWIHTGLTDVVSQTSLFVNVTNEFFSNLETNILNNEIRPKLRVSSFCFNVRIFVLSVESCVWLVII